MMKRYKLLLALALSLLVFWPLGAIKADSVNQPPESANQSEQASAAVVTNSSDSSAGARGTPSQDSQIAAKALTVSDTSTETAASSQAGNTGNLLEDSAKPATDQSAEVSSAVNQANDQAASNAPSASKRVQELVADMTLRQKITQMLMPDFRKWQQEGQASQSDMTE
ncbi:MAG: beta-hexosaminidase, partial [Streptococcus sp.]